MRIIEEMIPHIASLMVPTAAAALAHAQPLVIGLGGAEVVAELTPEVREHHRVIDLVGLPRHSLQCADYIGVCWG